MLGNSLAKLSPLNSYKLKNEFLLIYHSILWYFIEFGRNSWYFVKIRGISW